MFICSQKLPTRFAIRKGRCQMITEESSITIAGEFRLNRITDLTD